MKYLIPLLFLIQSCTFADWMCAIQGDCTMVDKPCNELDSAKVMTLRDSFTFLYVEGPTHTIAKPLFLHSAIPLQYEIWYTTDTFLFVAPTYQEVFDKISSTAQRSGTTQHIAHDLEPEHWTNNNFKYVYPINGGFLLNLRTSKAAYLHVIKISDCEYKAYGIWLKGKAIDNGEDVS